jgi:riboflavin kinase/FMN adenylyltransferase
MKLLRGLHNPPIPEVGCVATIGNFDGVHLGHQAIVARVTSKARELGLPSVVVVFEPQPQEYFHEEDAPARIMRFRDKFDCLESLSLDYLCVLKFDEYFRSLTARAFVEQVLVDHLKLKHLVIGDDFRFGGDRQGDFGHLVRSGSEFGFDVERTETLCTQQNCQNGERVSSTLIRQALAEGNLDEAKSCLGRPFTISGRVIYGRQLGRQLGFPTANVALKRLCSPVSGVFAVRANIQSGRHKGHYFGVANVGRKPTVGDFDANLEVHLFDFSGDIYGARVQVELLEKIREERRFESVDALAEQIQKDNLAAREFAAQQRQPLRLV